jgi:hypothetical protein
VASQVYESCGAKAIPEKNFVEEEMAKEQFLMNQILLKKAGILDHEEHEAHEAKEQAIQLPSRNLTFFVLFVTFVVTGFVAACLGQVT